MASDHIRKRIEDWLNRDAGLGSGRIYAGRLEAALGTAIGRRAENQDRCLVMTAAFPGAPERNLALAALCDGMGGMAHGGAFAGQALAAFTASILEDFRNPPEERLAAAARAANDAVHADRSGHGGATLSAVLIDAKHRVMAVNVGDSRIYGLDEAHRPTQITTDDTLAAHLDAIRGGDHSDIPKADQLVQFIGMGPGLEPHVVPIPENPAPESVLITSDGAHYFGQRVLRGVMVAARDAEQAIERLMTLTEWLGGRDNAAAIMAPLARLADFAPDDPPAEGLIEIWGPFGKVEFPGEILATRKMAARKAAKPRSAEGKKAAASPAAKVDAGKPARKTAAGKRAPAKAKPRKPTAITAKAPAKPSPVQAAPYRPKTGGEKTAASGETGKTERKPAAKRAAKPRSSGRKPAAKSGLRIKLSRER